MFPRMLARRASVVPRASSILGTQRRTFVNSAFLSNIVSHDLGLFNAATYTSVGALATSPIGTGALVLAAYNVCVVGLKHFWSTLEILVRDYVQDLVLAQTARYMLLVCLILCCAQLFVEA